MSEIAIQVENLSKLYRIGMIEEAPDTFVGAVSDIITRPIKNFRRLRRLSAFSKNGRDEEDTIWALRDVSFEVKRGEAVGIIGRNGAGKSTLLKILTRITDPTSGQATLHGRVGSLLEVGTGFHPELTGRENVYLNGTILGMKKKEIDRKFDEIVDFSGVEKFIDTPVKRYSSGMRVRLAFAVAAHLDPEILIVDEVLAVGDVEFQRKCLSKMGDVAKTGRTVLFVSHNMAAMECLCLKGFTLVNGKLVFGGTAREAIDYYLHQIHGGARTCRSDVVDLSKAAGRRGECPPLLQRLEFFTDGGRPVGGSLKMGASLKVRIYFRLKNPTATIDASLGFDNLHGQRVFSAHSIYQPNRPRGKWTGDRNFVCEIPSLTLVPGEYAIKVALEIDNAVADVVEDAARLLIVECDYYGTGKGPPMGMFVLKHHWNLT